MPRSAVCLVGEPVGALGWLAEALGWLAEAAAGPAGAWLFRVVSIMSPRGWVLSVLTPELSPGAASGTPDTRHDLAMTDVTGSGRCRWLRAAGRLEHEQGDLALGQGLVLRVFRPDLDRAVPPHGPLVAGKLAGKVVALDRPVLELNPRLGFEVVVP